MGTVMLQRESFLSQVLGKPIYDSTGKVVGHLRDLAVRWDNHYPRVTGIKFLKHLQQHIVVELISQWDKKGIHLKVAFPAELHPLAPDEIYVGKWLLDKQIIDTRGSKLVRVNDIMLAWIGSGPGLILSAVDVGLRGLMRRIGLEAVVRRRSPNLIDWKYIKPLESRTDNLRLTTESSSLKELHPADLADIIEDMDRISRNRFLAGLDRQTAIEALTETDLETQVEIITYMDTAKASALLADMPPDEAADILGELPEEKSDELLNLMNKDEAQDVRELMEYEENTAGAMMTTEFISFGADTTAEDCINRLRELAPSAETIYYLYVVDREMVLKGVVSLRDLIVAPPRTELGAIMRSRVVSVTAGDDVRRVQESVTKYDLLALPVVDGKGALLGIITVDDVMETVIHDRGGVESFTNFMTHGRAWRRRKP